MSYGYPSHVQRRLPESVYWRRRVVAAVALLVVVWVLWSIGRAVFGGTADVDGAADVTTGPPATVSITASPTAPPGQTIVEQTTSSTISPDADPRDVSAEDPARIYIAGDSDAGAIGPTLQSMLADTGFSTTTLDYKNSTGLARPDFYDWGARFNSQLAAINPDIIVVAIGGNDAQALLNADQTVVAPVPSGDPGGDAEWRAEYGRRVGSTMDFLAAGGRTLIWVGIPNSNIEKDNLRFKVQDEVAKAEADKRDDVIFIDTWTKFTGVDGGFAEYVTDPTDGEFKDVRGSDGWHLNENGARILSLDIHAAIVEDLRDRDAEI